MGPLPVGLSSLALSLPSVVRTNQHFRERHPQLLARAEGKGLARAFSPAAATEDQGEDLWTQELVPYLADPFRGTQRRFVLGPGESALTLERAAAAAALAAAGLGPRDIDLLIVSSLFPMDIGPGDAVPLAAALGLSCAAYNLESMCVGPWLALQAAAALLREGAHRRALLVSSCTYSRNADDDDTLAFFLADAGAALVVGAGAAPGPGPGEVLASHAIHTADTMGVFYCDLVAGADGEPRNLVRTGPDASRRIAATVTRYVRPCCHEVLRRAGLGLGDVDFFIFNTPTAWYERVLARALEIPLERTINCYPRYGNIGTVLPLANLYHAASEGRIRRGDLVLVFTMGYASNAVATLLRWGDTALAPLDAPVAAAQERAA